jgi:pseudouridine synthase
MSRRRAEDLIRRGRITIDGRIAVLGDRGDPESTAIAIDGVPLPMRPGLVYMLVYKPRDVISTAHDPEGRATVISLVDVGTRVYPVGRLDADSEGLLLLTNDGTLTNLITHPRNQVPKTYVARVPGRPKPVALRQLAEGIELEDGLARAVSSRVLDTHSDESLIEVVMAEGRKREVRRMFDAIGHPVVRLVRVAIGPIRDSRLAPGDSRALTLDEVRSLYSSAGATWEDAPVVVDEDATQ